MAGRPKNKSNNGQKIAYFSRFHGRVLEEDLWFFRQRQRNRVRDWISKLARRKNRV